MIAIERLLLYAYWGHDGDMTASRHKENSARPDSGPMKVLRVRETSSDAVGSSAAGTAQDQYRGPLLPECRGDAGARGGALGPARRTTGCYARRCW